LAHLISSLWKTQKTRTVNRTTIVVVATALAVTVTVAVHVLCCAVLCCCFPDEWVDTSNSSNTREVVISVAVNFFCLSSSSALFLSTFCLLSTAKMTVVVVLVEIYPR